MCHGRLLCPWNSPGKNTGSGLPFPPPGDLPDPGTKPVSPALQADSLPSEPPGKPHAMQWGQKTKWEKVNSSQCISPLLLLPSRFSCVRLCDPMDCNPSGSSVRGILQARKLEWVAIPSSRRSSPPRDWTRVSCICRSILYLWATRETHFSLEQFNKYLYKV